MAKAPAANTPPVDPAPPGAVDPAGASAAAIAAATTAPAADPALAVEDPDEFSKMFAQFSHPEKTPDPAPAPTPAAPDPAAAAPAPAAPDPAPAPAPEPAPQPVPDNVERLADILLQRIQPAPQQGQQPPAPFFNEAEIGRLQTYYTEWPEVAAAQDLVVRAAVAATRQEVYREIAGYLKPKLDMLDQLAGNFQYDVLERRIPDYASLQDKVVEWANSQPDYLKNAYTSVIDRGTPDQVEHLYARYRAETGLQTPPAPNAPVPAARVPSPPPADALSPAARQAAARLEPVNSKRTAPASGAPTTFEDGFEAAVREFAQAT
jgi:hypothetical protein